MRHPHRRDTFFPPQYKPAICYIKPCVQRFRSPLSTNLTILPQISSDSSLILISISALSIYRITEKLRNLRISWTARIIPDWENTNQSKGFRFCSFSPPSFCVVSGVFVQVRMVCVVSRTGRELQRYDQGRRLVVGWVFWFFLGFCILCWVIDWWVCGRVFLLKWVVV